MKHKMDPKDIFEFKMNSGSYKVCYFVFWHLLIRQQLTGFFCLQVPIFLVFFLAPASRIGSNALLSSRILASNKSFGHLSLPIQVWPYRTLETNCLHEAQWQPFDGLIHVHVSVCNPCCSFLQESMVGSQKVFVCGTLGISQPFKGRTATFPISV